ncbi:MAG: hypothetical protein R3B90_15935 [Planctomycetaceae bacterium]
MIRPPPDRRTKPFTTTASPTSRPCAAGSGSSFANAPRIRPGSLSGRFAGNAINEFSLYDLDNDIGETKNVASEHPEVLTRLRLLAHEARMDLGDYDHTGSGRVL